MNGSQVYWLGSGDGLEVEFVGATPKQLSELARFGLPILPSFILSTQTFSQLTEGLKISSRERSNLNSKDLRILREKLLKTKLAKLTHDQLSEAYELLWRRLDRRPGELLVRAVITGKVNHKIDSIKRVIVRRQNQLAESVVELYAELFNAKLLADGTLEDLLSGQLGIAIIFQPLLPVTASGILKSGKILTIEAIYGRVEPLLAGQLEGDRFSVDSQTLEILSQNLNRQTWKILDLSSAKKHRTVTVIEQTEPKINHDQIMELAKWGMTLNDQIDFNLALIWQLDSTGAIWFCDLQREATDGQIWGEVDQEPYNLPTVDSAIGQRIFNGQPLVAGTGVGPVRIVKNRTDLKDLADGDILLTSTTDLVPADQAEKILSRLSGWLVEAGNLKSSLHSLLEDSAIPVIRHSGLVNLLTDGSLLTVDGRSGAIYRGRVKPKINLQNLPPTTLVTATKLFIRPQSLTELESELSLPSEGIGYLSAKLIFEAIGEHPRVSLNNGSRAMLNQLVDQFCQVAAACRPRPVIYALNDLTSEHYRELTGGTEHEPIEKNPLLGYRGVLRSLGEVDLLRLELEAIRRTREDYGFNNLHLMTPFVRTLAEFISFNHLVVGSGLRPGRDFQLWFTCQAPSNLLILADLVANQQIQGICLDLDSLSQLLLGLDHSNSRLTNQIDILDQVVLSAIKNAVLIGREAGLPVNIVGRCLEQRPDALEAFLECGVTGLVIDPHHLQSIRQLVLSAEQRLILDHVLDR